MLRVNLAKKCRFAIADLPAHPYHNSACLYIIIAAISTFKTLLCTVLCPWARHFILCFVLVQPRKIRPDITEKLLTGTLRIKSKLSRFTYLCHLLIICKQFGPRSGLTKCRAWSGSKLFDTLTVFLKEFFQKICSEKISRWLKSMKNFRAAMSFYLDWSQ